MSRFEQENRVASVKIVDVNDDDLLLNNMFGVDKIGQPFVYTVEMLENEDAKIDLSKIVGKSLTISLKVTADKTPIRYFNGYIEDIRHAGLSMNEGLPCYIARVVPRISFLKKVWNSRVFRAKTVKDILTVVFKSFEPALEKFKVDDLPKDYPELEHCVQYRETDYAFVHRLMEEYGITYYFDHSDGDHEMVFLDSKGKRPKASSSDVIAEELSYSKSNVSKSFEVVRNWQQRKRIVTDSFAQSDFNFANKDKFPDVFSSKAEGKDKQGDFDAKSFQQYVYEAAFEEGVSDPHKLKADDLKKAAEKISKVRLGAFQAEKDLIYAESECRKVHVGYEFKLVDYEFDKTQNNKEYYVISVAHQINVGGYALKIDTTSKRYSCELTAIPKDTEYYPLQLTPKARIYGPQTATVVGEGAKDKKLIYTDKHGRIKIRFNWDRLEDRKKIDKLNVGGEDKVDKDTKNLSCWVRVAQGWAGNKWGSFFLPRVGQEIIVEFLDGDPDRPIITGSVYNAKNLSPYKLPDHDTISTIKSNNVGEKGEKAEKASFNEIRFEDKEKSEQIFIHAAKAMDTQVLGDHRTYVGNNMQLTIDGDDTGGNKDKIKDKSDDSAIGNRDVVIIKGNDQLSLGEGNLIQSIGGSHLLDVKKHLSISVAGGFNIMVGDKIVIGSEKDIHIKGANIVVEAKEAISFKAGKDITLDATGSINLKSGKDILGEGTSSVGFKGGQSTIELSAAAGISGSSGLVLKGSKVDINGAAPKAPAAPAAGVAAEDPTIESPKDLKQATLSKALKEEQKIETKGGKPADKIKFGEIE